MIKQLLLIEDGLLGVYARLGPVTVSSDSEKPYQQRYYYENTSTHLYTHIANVSNMDTSNF